VKGNFIGTDVTGTSAVNGDTIHGIGDKGSGNRIGGTSGTTPGGACTGDCNLISGNVPVVPFFGLNGGVFLPANASGTVIQGNFVGTDVSGTVGIGNGSSGIGIISGGPNVMIGGATPAARNVISGNSLYNVHIKSLNGMVQGNYIGTNSQGTDAIEANGTGILVGDTNGVLIGGASEGAGNVISGAPTGFPGVSIYRSTNIQVQGT
jgi:titin